MKKVGLLGVCLALVVLLNAPLWCAAPPSIPNMIGDWSGEVQGVYQQGDLGTPENNIFTFCSGPITLTVPPQGQQGSIFGGEYLSTICHGGPLAGLFTGHVSSTGQVAITTWPFSFSGNLSNKGKTLTGVLQFPGNVETHAITLNKIN